jgi:hypothetical protein
MKKKLMLVTLMLIAVFTLIACDNGEDPIDENPLTAITFSGADNVTLDFGAEFNVLEGVTATGNNDVDYTDQITYSHVATTIITDDVLDTTLTGNHIIKYEVEVEGILAQKFRTITVNEPAPVEGQMLVNADFSQGTAGWDGSAVYIADGAEMTLSTEEFDGNPALKAEVVAGSNVYTPRFGQMNVPFEEGITYEITFRAKSSVEKTINLQVGELLAGPPYFTDFKPGLTVNKTITTEWATYSFKFTMTLDNQRGGLLFELGALGGNAVNATIWFDDITIEEAQPDPDETAPTFTGLVASRSVLVGNAFDPMNGVTAFDIVDGDVTENIVVVIENGLGDVVSAIDTSVEDTFTITYTISDAAGNEAEFVVTLEVVGMQFSETNLIANPSFDAELNETTPEWALWAQDWGAAPVVETALDTTNGVYTVDVTGGGDAAWAVQVFQDGYLTLEEGVTYRLSVTVAAEVARKMNVALGYGDPWVEYARFNGVDVAEEATLEFLFTVTQPTHAVKLVFELGSQEGFADGMVTFSEVKLQEALLDDIVTNGTFADGWSLWYQNWGDMPTVTYDRTDGMFNITTDKSGEAGWAIQFNQYLDLETETTYVLSFDAKASVARDINVKLFLPDVWVMHIEQLDQMLTTEVATYTYEFTTGTDNVTGLTLSFELGLTTNFAAGTVSIDNVTLKEKDVAEAPELIVNGDATTVPNFMYDNAGEGVGTMVLGVDGGAVIDVTTLGSQPYTPHFYQMIEKLAPGNYTLKLVLDSSVDRDLRVNLVLPDAGWVSLLPDGSYDFSIVSTETNVVYVNFTVENEVTNVKFELDLGTLGGDLVSEVGVFTIHEVYIYQDLN